MDNTFKNMNAWKVDYNAIELHAQKYCQSWFGLILDVMGQALILATFLAISFQRNYAADSLDVGFAGTLFMYLFNVLRNCSLLSLWTYFLIESIELLYR